MLASWDTPERASTSTSTKVSMVAEVRLDTGQGDKALCSAFAGTISLGASHGVIGLARRRYRINHGLLLMCR